MQMAAAMPYLATAGKAFMAAAPYVAAAGTATTTLMQMSQQRLAGKAAKAEAETAAQAEELAATQREADRKAMLAEALASQTAYAGAGGISAFEGSPLAVMEENIRREKVDTERAALNTKLLTMSLRSRGTAAKKSAYGRSLLTGISGLTQTAQLMPLSSKKD